MSDILDLIDGAIADSTSRDAMRWTPEAEPDQGEQAIEWVRANTDHTLTPWQEQIIRQTYSEGGDMTLAFQQYALSFRDALQEFGMAMRAAAHDIGRWAETITPQVHVIHDEIRPWLDAKAQARRQLHNAYRQRALARKRRAR